MCAIAGIIGLPYDRKKTDALLSTMRRRGPDASGIKELNECCLLHTRLSIIDPDGGQQPLDLEWAGESYTIVYNGELYNTQELRVELESLGHTFKENSDTEVLMHAFVQWGDDCVHRLNGIFAFGVWEHSAKRLFLARDRIGVKPLFFCNHQDGLLFASEMKTILAYPGSDAELDAEGAAQLLLLGPGRMPGSGVFRGIRELEPGYKAVYQNERLSVKQYWRLSDREHLESFEDTAAYVRYLVTDSIKRQMVSDVPIGTFLSGGLDSSIITTICAGEYASGGKILPTFSLDYQDNDRYFVPGKFQPNSDSGYIHIMEEQLQTHSHWTVLTPEDLVEAMTDATCARDLPGMADVDFSLLAFCGNIRKEVKVALSGECADEIFGGYPWYRDPEVLFQNGFPWAQNTQFRETFLHPYFRGKLDALDFVNACYQDTISRSDILPGTPSEERRMKEMVNLNFRWFMQTLLDRKDRMSMYHGLEVRVPFCDHRIAEYLYGVPWKYKDYNSTEKGLLRYAMSGLLPNEILWRKKSPYPKTHDPRYQQLVMKQLEALMQDHNAPLFCLIDKNALVELLKGESAWPWYGQLMRMPQTIAYMLQLNIWLEKYQVRIL